jgi:hypothetical protein
LERVRRLIPQLGAGGQPAHDAEVRLLSQVLGEFVPPGHPPEVAVHREVVSVEEIGDERVFDWTLYIY